MLPSAMTFRALSFTVKQAVGGVGVGDGDVVGSVEALDEGGEAAAAVEFDEEDDAAVDELVDAVLSSCRISSTMSDGETATRPCKSKSE